MVRCPPVAVLVPVLARPARVEPTIRSLAAGTPSDYRLLFLVDPGDREEIDEITRQGADFYVCPDGLSWAAKINLGVKLTTEPLIFTAADDLDFRAGWLEAAHRRMTETVGVVGTNDLCNPRTMRGEHATHFLVARWYAEIGAIDGGGFAPEAYSHNFVDNEILETAVHRGAYAFAHDSLVEHLHPMNSKAENDSTYEKGAAGFRADRRLFRSRRPLWQT